MNETSPMDDMTDTKPIDISSGENTCDHDVEPIRDSPFDGQCVKCGEVGFPIRDPAEWEDAKDLAGKILAYLCKRWGYVPIQLQPEEVAQDQIARIIFDHPPYDTDQEGNQPQDEVGFYEKGPDDEEE